MAKSSIRFLIKRSKTGLGLFAKEQIPQNTFLLEYRGEIISSSEADLRGGKYLFELNSKRTIDGKGRDNLARYINHACRPNAEAVIEKGHVFIYSIHKIDRGQELTYDYGKEYFREFIRPSGCKCDFCEKKNKKRHSSRVT